MATAYSVLSAGSSVGSSSLVSSAGAGSSSLVSSAGAGSVVVFSGSVGGLCGLGCAGSQAQNHDQNQKQCKILLHLKIYLFHNIIPHRTAANRTRCQNCPLTGGAILIISAFAADCNDFSQLLPCFSQLFCLQHPFQDPDRRLFQTNAVGTERFIAPEHPAVAAVEQPCTQERTVLREPLGRRWRSPGSFAARQLFAAISNGRPYTSRSADWETETVSGRLCACSAAVP